MNTRIGKAKAKREMRLSTAAKARRLAADSISVKQQQLARIVTDEYSQCGNFVCIKERLEI